MDESTADSLLPAQPKRSTGYYHLARKIVLERGFFHLVLTGGFFRYAWRYSDGIQKPLLGQLVALEPALAEWSAEGEMGYPYSDRSWRGPFFLLPFRMQSLIRETLFNRES